MSETKNPRNSNWELEDVPCDYCGSGKADVFLSSRDRVHGLPGIFNVVICQQCGLARTNPRPTLNCLPAAYPDEYGPHHHKASRPYPPRGLLRWALTNFRNYPLGRCWPSVLRAPLWPLGENTLRRRRVLRYPPFTDKGRLLDLGCGAGAYVAQMTAAGWQAEGMDPSAQAVQIGRQAGLMLHEGTLPGANLPEGSFDVVTMWQVIEHLPSPMATLKAITQMLRPGGMLMVACPRIDSLPARWFGARWYDLDVPRHLWHFSEYTLRRHLRTAGFEIERFWAVRRPSGIRRSFANVAAETNKTLPRCLSHSRAIVGAMTMAALLARRTAQIVCLARRR